jgi:hypothetical protein
MTGIFDEPIRNLPEAAKTLRGVKACPARGQIRRIIFMQFSEDDVSEHDPAARGAFFNEPDRYRSKQPPTIFRRIWLWQDGANGKSKTGI